MHFPLLVIFSLILCTCQVLSQANIYEYSEQRPLSFVYTLYPFYNSEVLLEVWKGDKTVDIAANSVVTIAPREQEQTVLYSNEAQGNATNLNSQENLSYFLNDAKNGNEEQLPKNRQRLSNYRNKRKDTSP